MDGGRLIKFGVPGAGSETVRYRYGDWFETTDRMLIGPSGGQTSLLFELAGLWEHRSYWLLYVLLVGRTGRPEGRYQAPQLPGSGELRTFLEEFGPFLEQDGRHAFWIGSAAGEGTLVYDQHDVLFAYGDLAAYRRVLDRRGFVEQPFSYPDPHVHCYHAELDAVEERLFSRWEWIWSPLREDDHY